MQIKCPCCYAGFSLEAALDGEAGSKLLAFMAGLEPALARPLVHYLALFRSPSRALSWDRAGRLADEALKLESDRARLALALSKTVTVLREKQSQGSWKPLGNHNYLRRVLAELPVEQAQASVPALPTAPAQGPQQPKTQTGQAMVNLEGLIRGKG